jgi:putative transposase
MNADPIDPHQHHRRSIRLRGYNYAQAGAYFVTVCTQNRDCLFGEVMNGEVRLNSFGRIVAECWNAISKHFPNVELDESVVMPNHVHGILVIVDTRVGAQHAAPLQRRVDRGGRVNVTPGSLGAIIRSFKSAVTKCINELPNTLISNPWQRNYYEHIIRNERDLERIRQYILDNPADWDKDEYNPKFHV